MPTISEYTPNITIPQYKTTDYDVELDLAVLAKKQQQYDQALSKIRGLKNRALNIQMLNREGRQKLDEYNTMLEEELSKDLGDLSKIEVQNKIANMFQGLASDTSLIKASSLSKQYQDQIDTINSFRNSGRKDRGYNSINETVFMEWDGGLNDFANSSLDKVTSQQFQPLKYVPFKELDTKLLNIAKTLHQSVTERQTVEPGTPGYLHYIKTGGVTPERISILMQTQFDQEDLEQLDQMAKYEIIKNRKLGTISDFHEKYSVFSNNELKRVQAESSKAKQQASYLREKLKGKLDPDEEQQIIDQVARLESNSEILDNRVFDLESSIKSLDDFENMSNQELVEYAKEMQWANKIKGVSESVSWKMDSDIYKTDPTYLALKKLDTIRWQETIRAQTKLTLKALDKESKTKQPEFSGVGDPVKNKQDVFKNYEHLVEIQESLAKNTNRIIDSPTFVKEQLSDKSFIKQNAGNYHIKMWDLFTKEHQGFRNGQPQTEAFNVWLQEQEQNPSSPYISAIVEQQRRDEYVSDYVDDKVTYINEIIQKKYNDYDTLSNYNLYKANGKPLSKQEYMNGERAYIGIPNKNKTSYDLISLDQALKETEEFEQELIKKGGATAYLLETAPRISNDYNLYRTLKKANDQRKNSDKIVKSVLEDELPQIAQFGMSQTLNKEAIQSKIPDIMGAAKHSNKNAQFGIGVDDVEFANVPVGSGNYGQFKIKDGPAKTYQEQGWQLPSAADPSKLITITPGATYAFSTQPMSAYDTYFNLILEERPWTDYYKGYKIELNKSDVNKNLVIIKITDPKGLPVGEPKHIESGADAKNYLEIAKNVIDGF